MATGRIHLAAFLAAAMIAAPVWAQTSTSSSSSSTSSTGTSSASGSTTRASTTGSFQRLSPGQQKIARALFEAQQPTADGPAPLSLDQVAALKNGTGWGQVFKQMKSEGLVGDAKNLGQVVSGHATVVGGAATPPTSGLTGTTVTTANGRSISSGKPQTSTGDETQSHGNSAHVSNASATASGDAGAHGAGASVVHAH